MSRVYRSYLLIFILILISILFLSKAFYNAVFLEIHSSKDFLIILKLSEIFLNKIDVFKYYFEENNNYAPMWSHLCYLLFSPITKLPTQTAKIFWFFCNLVFFFLTVILIKKNYKLTFYETAFLSFISITSTPFTNTLGNGQLGLFFLFILTYYWYSNYKYKKFVLTFFSLKISFGFFFVLNSFLKKEADFFIFILFNFLAILIYSLNVNELNVKQFINPILVITHYSANFSMDGIAGLREIFKFFNINGYYFILLSICVFFISIFFYRKKKNNELFLSIIVLTLFLFYHRIYDFVLLIPMIAYTIKEKNNFLAKYSIFITIFYFFYFIKINDLILNNFVNQEIISFMGSILLMLTLILINFNFKKNKNF